MEQDIQQLFNYATKALKDLESGIRATTNTPEFNIKTKDYKLVSIPEKYIRTADYYRNKYKLNEIIINQHERDNIAYSLQLSDLYNYFINRFNIFLSVGVVFRKYALINIVSIQEGILNCTYNSLRKNCLDADNSLCKYNSNCKYYLKSLNGLRNNGMLDNYQKLIKFYNKELFRKLKEQKNIRDRIHLQIVDKNEFLDSEEYSIKIYNQSIVTLRFLQTFLPKAIEIFKEERNNNCKKITVCNK